VREELTNGGAKQQLASGKWAVVAYLSDGEMAKREEVSPGRSFL
jgi:hypothetical protein